jgi:hypothetical protein
MGQPIMKTTSTDTALHLAWVQASALERHFELYSANGLLGELRFETLTTAVGQWTGSASRKPRPAGAHTLPEIPALWAGSLMFASPAAKRWTFKAAGILKPRVTIRETGADADLAVYRHRFLGWEWVEFARGSRFDWKSTSFWKTEKGFYNGRQELVFALKPKFFNLLKEQSDVKVAAQWRDLEELPLLLMLACYMRVRQSNAGT